MEKFSPDCLFEAMNRCHETGKHRTAIIVFAQSNFTTEYSELSRSYESPSDQNGWNYKRMGNCRLGDCLDGTEQGVRLDWYDWEIEYWYWKD